MFKKSKSLQILAFVFASLCVLGISVAAAQGITFEQIGAPKLPWDAVPSPDGSVIYYTAASADGLPGVFSVSATGGEPSVLASQPSLVMPLGLAVSTDGQTLYVSDPWTSGSNGSALYSLSTMSPSQPQRIEGTQGTAPQGVEVVSQNGADQIYFTGIDPKDGQAAVYKVAAAGGGLTVVTKGAPLVAPSGIAISKDGTLYVLDRLASGNGLGAVLRVQGGSVDIIARDVRTGGQLAGLTLTLDEALLLVSSLDGQAGTAQVLVVDLATMQTSIINDVIGANTAAGGLHRAHNENIFAWADSTGGPPGGKVFTVTLR
jgi:DNA-binding beta-propeller fold protein YncE